MDKKKLRYAILKALDTGNYDVNATDFDITEGLFDSTVWFLANNLYIAGIVNYDDRPHIVDASDGYGTIITEKGENYLEENSTLAKTYKGLKEARDWLRL